MTTRMPRLSRLIATFIFLSCHSQIGRAQNYLATGSDLNRWLGGIAERETQVNNVGSGFQNPLGPGEIRIITCTERRDNNCGGRCWAFQVSQRNMCYKTQPEGYTVNCLAATKPMRTYPGEKCEGVYKEYVDCATRLSDGFCHVPGTKSAQIHEDNAKTPDGPPSPPPATSASSSVSSWSSSSSSGSSPSGSSSSSLPSSNQISSGVPTLAPAPSSSSVEEPTASSSTSNWSRHSSNASEASHSESSTGSDSPSPAPPRASIDGERSGQALPVGAIIGIALGSLLAGVAALAFLNRLRKRHRKKSLVPSNPPSEPFNASRDLPAAQYLAKPSQETYRQSTSILLIQGPGRQEGTLPSTANSSVVEIDHEDSGARITTSITTSLLQPSRKLELVVEHPPPYTAT
ncbi:hypothetical protein BKA70DRAFT_1409323 [Coprinopsis sp. MPI-PUGE-AT-0042]|nr:hypothetical protein BKA70DRAFT_1409323 [Coprinopsis sp. MPI-PUGE-AT-0042]